MRHRVGSLTLVIAVSGATLYVLRAIRFGEMYTDWTRPVPEGLILALPYYLAMLGMVVPAVPISALLGRAGIGSPLLRTATLVTAIFGVVTFLLMTMAAYDSMWITYMGPFGLNVPPARPRLPQEVFSITSNLGPALMGGWMALTSVQLARSGTSRVLCFFGVVTGLGIIATMPYAGSQFVFRTVLPLELILALFWASALGVYFMRVRRATSMA